MTESSQTPHAFTEVATLNGGDFTFSPQDQFGKEYKQDDVLVFNATGKKIKVEFMQFNHHHHLS